MPVEERAVRLVRLLEILNRAAGPVPVGELAQLSSREFGVSEVTLRADLAALCSLGGVRKLARGSYTAGPDGGSPSFGETLFGTRLLHRAEAKIAIARAVADFLAAQPDLRVLLLDAGTTTYYLADLLSERSGLDLIVWTPSVAAAYRLAGVRGASVRLLGGELQADYAAVSGDETARGLRALAGAEGADPDEPLPAFPGAHCVLDVNLVDTEGRLYTDESRERLQKRLMAELAEDLTLVADHSKLFVPRLGLRAHEVNSLDRFAGKRRVRLVTDAAAGPDQRDRATQMMQRAFPMRRVVAAGGEGPDGAVVIEAIVL